MGIRRVVLVALLSVVFSACSGESASDGDDGGAPTTQPATEQAASDTPIEAGIEADGDSLVFSWEPIAGADSYGVVVLDANDAVVWIWTGIARSVTFGAFPEYPDDEEVEPEIVERFGPLDELPAATQSVDLAVPSSGNYVILGFDGGGAIVATHSFDLAS